MVVRRRTTANAESSPDINPPTIIKPAEGAKALVTEQLGGKTVQYEADISQDETETDIETDDETEDGISFDEFEARREADYQEIPKDPLTLMFDGVREAQNQNGEVFIANIMRRQDFMNDNFNSPCSVDSPFPPLQFTARDIFTFIATLQKHNNNSGGRFTINVYRQDGTPLKRYIGKHGAKVAIDLGIAMLAIPNPTAEQVQQNKGDSGNNNGLGQILLEMQRQNQESNRQLLEELRKPKEKSEIETLVMSLAVQKMMNPEAPRSNNTLEETMASMMLLPSMVEGMSRKMFPEPTPEREPDTFDKIEKVLNIPQVQNIVDGLVNIAETAAVNNLTKNATANGVVQDNQVDGEAVQDYYEQPEPQGLPQNDDMNSLITEVITELKSENALDDSNVMIKNLSDNYPDQFDMIVDGCKGMQFDGLLNMVINRANKLNPNPFLEFLNLEATQTSGAYVWTTDGERIKGRLSELYEYLKTYE